MAFRALAQFEEKQTPSTPFVANSRGAWSLNAKRSFEDVIPQCSAWEPENLKVVAPASRRCERKHFVRSTSETPVPPENAESLFLQDRHVSDD